MPYVDASSRARLADITQTAKAHILPYGCTVGELNYLITRLCRLYLERNGTSYTHVNDVVGALECAKLEFYRRVVVPYENEKWHQNGDVYDR